MRHGFSLIGAPGIDPPEASPPLAETRAYHLRGFAIIFGAPGIEPGLPAPKAGVLPVYYAPCKMWNTSILYRLLRSQYALF